MKRFFAIINLVLSITVLFSILCKSVHSYEHIFEQLSQKKCNHQQLSGTQITHDHHGFDHCFVCEFTFSNFTSSGFFTFDFIKSVARFQTNPFISSEKIYVFSANFFSLRAPPIIF